MISSSEDAGQAEASSPETVERFQFPRWANYLFPAALILIVGLATYVPFVGTLAISPNTRSVGYQPEQPIPFSHAVHAGKLKMDCRYCHSSTETSAFAAIPPTQTCLNCHASIKSESPKLQHVRKSYESGDPIPWKKVHSVPDFVYFNHSIHVNKGVACESCHGRIDEMEEVFQAKSLSMAWCLECHRAPENHLRHRESVTKMGWDAPSASGKNQIELGRELVTTHHIQSIQFMTSCSTCHR